MEEQAQHPAKSKKIEKQTKIVFLAIVGILIILGLLIFFSQKVKLKNTFMYNDEFEVVQLNDDGFIHYKIKIFVNDNSQPFLINARYNPKDIESIPVDEGVKEQILNSKQVYVTITPYTNLTSTTAMAAFEIKDVVDNPLLYNKPVNSAFTEPYKNGTVKTCSDATEEVSVVWLKISEETKVSLNEKCIIITGVTEEDIVKAAEKLVLSLLGVIKL